MQKIKSRTTKTGTWDARNDAEALHKAMRGVGTNEKVLVEIFGTRSRKHLQEVKSKFDEMYGKSLESWIKGDCSGSFQKLLLDLCEGRTELKCKYIRNATSGMGTDEDVLIQLLCPCSNEELKKLDECYRRMFGCELNSVMNSELSGDLKELMKELLKANRRFDEKMDEMKAKKDCEFLWSQGEGKVGTNERMFIEILTQRSHSHIQHVFRNYEQKTGHTFERALRAETRGDFRKALMAIMTPQPEYHAHLFSEAMKGAGTKDEQLLRLMSTLTKSQIKEANSVFTKKNNRTLQEAIKSETSGSFQALMCALVPSLV